MEYRVYFWHTCKKVPTEFLKHCSEIIKNEGNGWSHRKLELNKDNYFEVISTLKDFNIMILNDSNTIWIDEKHFKAS